MNKTFLVTGCAGFIPSHLVDRLLTLGYKVIGVDDLSIGKKEAMGSFINSKNFQFIKGDVRSLALIRKIVPEVNYIYHGAVRGVNISTDNPIEDVRVNTESTLLLLEEARKNKIDLFIYPSSASVYGNPKSLPEKEDDNPLPLSPYGVSKLAAERYCLVYLNIYKLPVVCLRYFNNYGPRQRKDSIYGGVISIFFEQVLNNENITVYGDGEQTRDFVYVDDTVFATIECINNKRVIGEVINISTGKETSINNLANKIADISGGKINVKHTTERKIDNIQRRAGDNSKANELLNFSPKVDLDRGLEKTYVWFKGQN